MTLLFSTAPFASVTVGSPHVVTTAAAISPPSTSEEHRSALPADALRSGEDIAHVPQRAATNAFQPLDAYHTMPSDDVVASFYHHRHGCTNNVMGSEGLGCCGCGCGCSDEGRCNNNNIMTSGGNVYPSAQRLPAAHLSASRAPTQQVPSWPMVPSATGFAAAAAATGEAPSAATPMRMTMKESRCVACGQAATMSNVYGSSSGPACQAGCLCTTNAAMSAMLTTSNNNNSRMQRAATDASAFMSHALRERNETSETDGSRRLVPSLPISPPMHSRTSYATVPNNSNTVYSNGYSYPHPYNNGNSNNNSVLYGDPMYEPDEKERLGRLHIAFKSLSKAERQRRVEEEAAATDLLARTVHLRFLPPCMFQHELAALCAACGEYLRIRICGNGQRNQNWIYGFVEFATRDGAVRMMQQSGRELYNGPTRPPLRLRCSAAKHPIVDRVFHDADPANKTLCIFGLGSYANRTLRDALESYTHLKEKEALLQHAQQEQQPCVEQPCLSMTALSTSTGNNTRPSSTLNGVEEEETEATCVRANGPVTPSCLTERHNRSDPCAPSPVCSLAASLHHYAAPHDHSALTATEATTTTITTTATAMTPSVRLVTTQTGPLPHTLSPATTSASRTIAGPQEQPLVHPLPLRTEATPTMTTTLLPGARNTAQLLQYMMNQETTTTRDDDGQAAMWRPWDMRDCAEASAPGCVPSQAQGNHYNNNSNRMDAAVAGSVGDKENMTSDHEDVAVTCNSMASCMHTAAPLQPCAAGRAPVCEATHMSAIPAMNAATRQAASRALSARAAPFVPMSDLATASLTLQPAHMPTGQDMLRTTQGITITSDGAVNGMASAYKTHKTTAAAATMCTQTTPHNVTHDVHHPRRVSSQLPISPYAMAADKSTHSNSNSSDSGAVSEMGCQLSCMLEHVMRSRGGSDGEEVLERARLLMLRALRHCVNATSSQLDFCNTVGTLHSLLELLREQAVLTGGPAQTSIADCARHLPQRTTQLQLLANLLLALLWLARRHLGKALPYVHAVVTCCNDIPLQPLRITQGVPNCVTSSCCCCCGVSCPSSRAAMSTDDMSGQDGAASAKSCAKVTSDTDMPASEAVLRAAVRSHALPACTNGGTSHDAEPTTTTAAMVDMHDDKDMAAAKEGEESHSGLHRRVTSDELLLNAVLDTLGSSSRSSSSNNSNSSSDEDDDVDMGEIRQRHNVTALHLSPTCDACLGGEQVTQSSMTRALPLSEQQQQQAQSAHDVAFHCHVLHVLLCVGLAMELVEPAVAMRTYALAAHRARAVLGMSCAVLDAWLAETTSAQPLSSASSSSATCVMSCGNNNNSSSSSSGLLAKMWQSTGSNSSSSSNDSNSSGGVCEAAMADITTFPRLFFRSVASQLPRLMGSQAVFWHELPPSACMRCFRCSQVET